VQGQAVLGAFEDDVKATIDFDINAIVLPQSKQEFAFVRVSGNTLAEEYP